MPRTSTAPMSFSIRILLVDDHAVVREGYKRLMATMPHLNVCAEASCGQDAYGQFLTARIDVVVMDLELPDLSGIEVIRRMHLRNRHVRTLAFSMHDQTHYVQRALDAGALGYVCKRSRPEILLEAIQTVAAGERYVDPAVAVSETPTGTPLDVLSEREFEIFRQLAAGVSPSEIALALHLSGKTIANYGCRIRAKLGVSTDAALAHLALRQGLLSLPSA